jgi:hypothetical protein
MINIETAKRLDVILNKLVEINSQNGRTYLDLSEARKIFPEFENLKSLFEFIDEAEFNGKPIVRYISTKTETEIYINSYTNLFVQNGGFLKKQEDQLFEDEFKKHKDEMEFKKLILDVKNLEDIPNQVKFNRKATYLSLIIASISILIALIALFFKK